MLSSARSFILIFAAAALLAGAGCNTSPADQQARDEKTRDEVAKATEKIKPAVEEAGRKLDEAARDIASDAKATAQGVHDGWTDSNGKHPYVDVNSATKDQLEQLPGVGEPQARRIIDHRPYADKHDLVDKGAISDAAYAKLRDRIVAR